MEVAIIVKAKELPKVLRDKIIKQHSNVSCRAIAKNLNIPVSTNGSKICRWKVNGTPINSPRTGDRLTRFHNALSDYNKEGKREASSETKVAAGTESSRKNSYTENISSELHHIIISIPIPHAKLLC